MMDTSRKRRGRYGSRYLRILGFFGPAILSIIGWDIILPRLGLRSLSRRTRSERLRGHARNFRALAAQMGGMLIKIGQFLSARLDVLPTEITDELAGGNFDVDGIGWAILGGIVLGLVSMVLESLLGLDDKDRKEVVVD